MISDADNEQVSYQVNFQDPSKEFSVQEVPISEEERMALLINKSVEQVPFNIQFKHIGKSLQFDTSVHQTVMDWEQKHDPETITNFEQCEMLKKRKNEGPGLQSSWASFECTIKHSDHIFR